MEFKDVWQTSPDLPVISLSDSMRAVFQNHGKSPLIQTREFASLAFAPGKLRPNEYFYYRLFEARYDESHRRQFVGARLEPMLHQLTCDSGSWIVAHDKLLCYSLLQSLGYPVPRTHAIYRRGADFPGIKTFGNKAELATALRGVLKGPLFGKPVRGIRSTGVVSIEGYDANSDSVQLAHGNSVGVEELIEALETYAEDGYLFQERVCQHTAVAEICGDAVGTVRIIVLVGSDGPEIYRALWKLPTGTNIADNFWREGNILAALDPRTGRIMRALKGIGTNLQEVNTHPTSGKSLSAVTLPDWQSTRRLVQSAARAFPDLKMQAWDVALSVSGPILVELNVGGDYNLPQLATGQGMLDERFLRFLNECAINRGLNRMLRKLRLDI